MSSRISGIFPLLLITILCVGGVETFYFLIERYVLVPRQEQAAVGEDMQKVPAKAVVSEASRAFDHAVIMRRNLFGPPPAEKTAADKGDDAGPAEELEATTLGVVLMGTVHGADGENRAIILKKKDRKQELYRVGDSVEGAHIKEIRRGKIVITLNGQDQSLDMSEASKYGSTKSAGPVAAVSPRRRPATTSLPAVNTETQDGQQQVQPRVVRPTRKIVSSQRRRTVVVPDDKPEDMEELQNLSESVENGEPVEQESAEQ